MISPVLLTLLLPAPAHACGGFFCNTTPVDQSGEDIVFSVDEDKGEVTVHVQIAYQGAAEEFAWIVPVPQAPELVLSTDRLFQELAWRTQPRFNLEYKEIFRCEGGIGGYGASSDAAFSASSPAPPSASGGGVTVVSEQQVGPYDTVTLQADTSEALLGWLQDNDYLLPDSLDPVLAPYVADGSFFVALKLSKDSDVGELAPLGMRYPGDLASVPIQLTSIAATEDMRLRAYVIGDSRAVPESYLHVQINDLVVDWFSGGSNWEDAITIAADEAGGQAFATDYSGSTDVMEEALYRPGMYDVEALASSPDAYAFFDEIVRQGFPGDSTMMSLFQEFLPMPPALAAEGVSEQDFYNCLSCYTPWVDAIPFDAAAFADAIDERIVSPLRLAQRLFDDHSHLTRLTSSVSPIEMTKDPTFVFNRDMEQTVELERKASLEFYCGFGGTWSDSERRLVLADGRSYRLPSQQWFWDHGLTEYEYLSKLMDVYALIIEETGPDGEPVVLFDGSEDAWAAAGAFNGGSAGAGCGCTSTSTSTASGVAGALALFGLLLRRRRA